MDFHSMKRKELQAMCKSHGIPANLSNVEMANRLTSIFKGSEKEKPLIRGRSCMKVVDEVVLENDSDVANRKVKKVRFSPENELIQFMTKSVGKRGCRRKSSVSDNEVRITTRRALRNREMQDGGLGEREGVIQGLRKSERQRDRSSAKGIEDVPQVLFVQSKRNAAKNENSNGESLGEVVASVSKTDEIRNAENGDKEVGVITRRSLRNREITVEGKREREDDNAGLRRSGRQSKRGPLGIHVVLQTEDIVEEHVKELRRSKRNVTNAKEKDTVIVDENKNFGKVRLGRDKVTLAVKTSKKEAAELKIAKDSFASSTASISESRACTKRVLRNKKHAVSEGFNEGLQKMGGQIGPRNEKSSEEDPQNKQIEEEANKALRRSKRNAAKMDDPESLYNGIGKSKIIRKEQKMEASIPEAMSESEIAALEKHEEGKEPETLIRRSPQNSVMPLLEKAIKEMEASALGPQSETETAAVSRLEFYIQVEEATSASSRSSSFDAVESRLEVVNQVERTSASPRGSAGKKSGITLLENVENIHQNMNQDLSGLSTLNATPDVEIFKTGTFHSNSSFDKQVDSSKTVANSELIDNSSKSFEEHECPVAEEMRSSRRIASTHDNVNSSAGTGRIHKATVNDGVENESCNKISTPADTSSRQSRTNATSDDQNVHPVGKDKDAGNKNPLDISISGIMASGVSLAEDMTKSKEQCAQVVLLSETSDTETAKEPASPEPLTDGYCLGENESEETSHQKNQFCAEELNSPKLVSEEENSCSELVDLQTDSKVQLVDITVTESKGFAEMVDTSMQGNVEHSLDDLVVAKLAEQEAFEDFNVERDSDSVEVNNTIDCYRSNGQSCTYLTVEVREMQSKDLTKIDYAESGSKEEEFTCQNDLVIIAEQLNIAERENLSTEVSLAEDRTCNWEKKSPENGDCTQIATLSCVGVADIPNEAVNSTSFIDTYSNEFEELAQQSKQVSSPKGGNRKEVEEVKSPQLVNAVQESCSELLISDANHVEQEKVLVDELICLSGKVNISVEENTEKSVGGINVDIDTIAFEINSPTKAYGCINQSDLTADVKEKQNEEVAELQCSGSLSKDTGSIFQLVEHAVKDELSDGKQLAVIAVSNDDLQDILDDRPGENIEDVSRRIEESVFVDSSEKHACDASLPEVHAVDAEQFSPVLNKEPANTADRKKALELEEQPSSKLRNSIELAFVVEGDKALKDEDLEDQVNASGNNGKPSESDAMEGRSETSLQEATGSNGEGAEIHSQRTHPDVLETGRGLCECDDRSDGMEPVLDQEFSYSVSPSKCSDDEEQEEQLGFLFSTPVNDGNTCEENVKGCNKTSGLITDASNAGEERNLFAACGDVLCPDGNDEYRLCSHESGNTSSLETCRCLSDCVYGSDSFEQVPSDLVNDASHCGTPKCRNDKDQEYQLGLLFSTPTSIRSLGKENAKAFTTVSNTTSCRFVECSNAGEFRKLFAASDDCCSGGKNKQCEDRSNVVEQGKELMQSFTTSDASCADGKTKSAYQNGSTHSLEMGRVLCEYTEKLDSLEEEDQLRLLFSTPNNVRGTVVERAKALYMHSNQGSGQLIEGSHAVQTVLDDDMLCPTFALTNVKEQGQELQENDLLGNVDADRVEISKFAEPWEAHGYFPEKCEVPKEKGVETEGSFICSDNAITKLKVADCLTTSAVVLEEQRICSEAVALQGGFAHGDISQEPKNISTAEKISEEDGLLESNNDIYPCAERPDSGAESSTLSPLKLNFSFGGNMEEKAQKPQDRNICTSSKCNYIVKDEDIRGCPTVVVDKDELVANSNLFFASPSKFYTILEGRDEAAPIDKVDSKSNECTSANDDSLGANTYIGQPLMAAEMGQPSSGGLVELHENSARTALHVSIENIDPSTLENGCRTKAAEMELYTSESCLDSTQQSTVDIDSDGDKGNSPCHFSTPFQEKFEVAKEKGVETDGSNICSDNAITNLNVADCLKASAIVFEEPWISSDAVVLQDGFILGNNSQELNMCTAKKRSKEDGPLDCSSDIYPYPVNAKDEDIKGCPTAVVDNDQLVANCNLFFASPSKFHTILEGRDELVPQECSARAALYGKESRDLSVEGNECTDKPAEIELYTSESCLKPTHQSTANTDSDGDKGFVEDASLSFEKNNSTEKQNAADVAAGSSFIFRELNSLMKRDTRSILIHATPYKKPVRMNTKENDPTVKGELIGTLTAAKPEKRQPLKDLQWK